MARDGRWVPDVPPAPPCHCERLKADRCLLLQHLLGGYPALLLPPGQPLHSLDLTSLDVPAVLRAISANRPVDLSRLPPSPAALPPPLGHSPHPPGPGPGLGEGAPCRLATYEAVLLAAGLLHHADPLQLEAILTDVRLGLAISAEEHAALLGQLCPQCPALVPRGVVPADVAAHFAAQRHCATLADVAQRAAVGYGYRWELISVAASRAASTDAAAAFLRRQCLAFAAGFTSSLRAAGQATWHIDADVLPLAEAEATVHARLEDVCAGLPGAVAAAERLLHALAAQLPPHCAIAVSEPVPNSEGKKPKEKSGKSRSGSIARLAARFGKKERLPSPSGDHSSRSRRLSHPGATVVPAADPVGCLSYSLPYQPAVGAQYYRQVLAACDAAGGPAPEGRAARVAALLEGLLQPRWRVGPALHRLLRLEGSLPVGEGADPQWRERIAAVERQLADLPENSTLQEEERQQLRGVLRAIVAQLRPALAEFHRHLAGCPQPCRATVTAYCAAHRRLHEDEGEAGAAALAADLEDCLFCAGTAAYYARRAAAERWRPITTIPQLQRFAQEDVLPFLQQEALPFASLVAALGDTAGSSLPTAFVKCLAVDCLALLTAGKAAEPPTVSDALLGLLQGLRGVVCAAHEAGVPVDFTLIAADASTLNGVLDSVATAWEGQVEVNFRQYFDHLVAKEQWSHGRPLTPGQAFDSAVDLLHIFDVNVPAVTGLLLPRAPAFVLRYAQSVAALLREYALLVARHGGGDAPGVGADPADSVAERWLRAGLPEDPPDEGAATPSATAACQALNTLGWLRPSYRRLLGGLCGREIGSWMDITLRPGAVSEPLLQNLDNLLEQLTGRLAHHLGRHLVFTPPCGPPLLADLYAVDLKHYRAQKAAVKAHGISLEAALVPATGVTLDALLQQLDPRLSVVRDALASEEVFGAVAVQVALQLSRGLLHVLLAGGEARVFSPQRADGLYGDLRAVVQFFCPYEAEALRAVLAQEVALLRAVVDVMQVPSQELLDGGRHGPGYDSLDDSPGRFPLTRAVVRAVLLHRKDPPAKRFAKRTLTLVKLPSGLRGHVATR